MKFIITKCYRKEVSNKNNKKSNNSFFIIVFPQKIWGGRCKKVNLAWTFHTVPKNYARYKSVRCIGTFLREADRDLDSSTKKAMTRCPLNSKSAIDRFAGLIENAVKFLPEIF